MYRHVQQYGLATTYQQRTGMHDYIRQLMALPFLPASHIRPTFDHLKTKANPTQLKRFVEYIDNGSIIRSLMCRHGASSARR